MTDELSPTSDKQPAHPGLIASTQTPSPRGALPGGAVEQPTLDILMQAARPLVQAYFDNQKEMQRRELVFEEKALVAETTHRRTLVRCGTGLLGLVLVLAAYLIYHGRDETAIKLITLIVGLGGAAFGGYGVAVSRSKSSGTKEE